MNVVQPQLVLMAAGMWISLLEVRLFPWMETGRHPGREKHVKAGRWGVGGRGERGRGMFLGQAGGVDGQGTQRPNNRQGEWEPRTYADSQARISRAGTAHTPSR